MWGLRHLAGSFSRLEAQASGTLRSWSLTAECLCYRRPRPGSHTCRLPLHLAYQSHLAPEKPGLVPERSLTISGSL